MPDDKNANPLRDQQYKDSSNLCTRVNLHERYSTNTYGWHRWIFDQIDLLPTARILELGCGPGLLWRENLYRVPDGWDITLSDFSEGMVDEAREHLGSTSHPFCFEIIDAQSIPFDDNCLDAVIANHMLYHVPDIPRALAEICRVLRPGAQFYASTVGLQHMIELRKLATSYEPSGELWQQLTAGPFNLENGLDQLQAHFAAVTLMRYEDDLLITEPEPLVEYILSSGNAASLSVEEKDRMAALVLSLIHI